MLLLPKGQTDEAWEPSKRYAVMEMEMEIEVGHLFKNILIFSVTQSNDRYFVLRLLQTLRQGRRASLVTRSHETSFH